MCLLIRLFTKCWYNSFVYNLPIFWCGVDIKVFRLVMHFELSCRVAQHWMGSSLTWCLVTKSGVRDHYSCPWLVHFDCAALHRGAVYDCKFVILPACLFFLRLSVTLVICLSAGRSQNIGLYRSLLSSSRRCCLSSTTTYRLPSDFHHSASPNKRV